MTTKKNKRIFIIALIGVVLFVVPAWFYVGVTFYNEYQERNRVYTFDEITQNKAEDIDYILAGYHTSEEYKQEFLDILQNQVYKEYNGNVGSLACETFRFYDENNNFLFSIMSWGEGERICISFNRDGRPTNGYYYMSSEYWDKD